MSAAHEGRTGGTARRASGCPWLPCTASGAPGKRARSECARTAASATAFPSTRSSAPCCSLNAAACAPQGALHLLHNPIREDRPADKQIDVFAFNQVLLAALDARDLDAAQDCLNLLRARGLPWNELTWVAAFKLAVSTRLLN